MVLHVANLIRKTVLFFGLMLLTSYASAEERNPSKEELIKIGQEAGAKLQTDLKKIDKKKFDEFLKTEGDKVKEARTSSKPIQVELQNLPKPEKQEVQSLRKQAEQFDPKSMMVQKKNIYVFVTLSMPDPELQALIKEATAYNAKVIIRGLHNNDFKMTMDRLRKLITDDNKGVIHIDPMPFKDFKIQEVPAFVMTTEVTQKCFSDNCEVPRHAKAVGSVSIKYFLETVEREGSPASKARAAEILSGGA